MSQPSDSGAVDARYMQLALSLGRRGLGNAYPNPAVGAVIVKDGVIVGRGWTQPGGRPHAEVEALRQAKKQAKGATLYCTLEPCSHEGKSPPCADAIIKAGIARVVSALEDPNPEVAGQGHARMRDKGITVDVGLMAEEACRAHAGHIARIQKSRPHVTLKLAVSSDGKAGLAGRKRIAITGEEARDRVWLMRGQSDAILVGIGTVLSDNPQLTCRLPGLFERSPIRVVLDAKLSVPMSVTVISTVRDTPTWVFTSHKASPIAEEVLKILSREGITRLLVEGGPTVAAAFASADLVDEAVLLHGAREIGEGGIAPLEGMALEALTGKLTSRGSERLGADTLETFERA